MSMALAKSQIRLDAMSELSESDKAERDTLLNRIRVAVFELNLLMRAASMYGVDLHIDTTERVDPITTNEYSEFIISGIPDLQDDDEPI